VARECDGPGRDAVNTVCPLQCRQRQGGAGDNPLSDRASAPDQVDWAGLPINLDLAFSREHRDKVYAQHLMRKRGAQLWRWLRDGGQLCVCDLAAEPGQLAPGAGQPMFSR
jgi:hypothetical protein